MGNLIKLVLLCGAIWLAYNQFAVTRWASGMLVANAPVQRNDSALSVWQKDEYSFKALAAYSLDARVLSKSHYSDDLSPYDLALGWQEMSDTAVVDRLAISQFARYYQYRWSGAPPVSAEIIATTSANHHMIPASEEVRRTLSRVREGDLVAIRGYLVSIHRADGWHWNSSLTRNDKGPGACELVWVDSLTILNHPPNPSFATLEPEPLIALWGWH